jgi:hypothetical protein
MQVVQLSVPGQEQVPHARLRRGPLLVDVQVVAERLPPTRVSSRLKLLFSAWFT